MFFTCLNMLLDGSENDREDTNGSTCMDWFEVQFMPKFSVSRIWQRWRDAYPKYGSKADNAITGFTGVPTIYTRLIQGYEAMDPGMQSTSALAASHLRLMMCGSSALPYPVMQQWEAITGLIFFSI